MISNVIHRTANFKLWLSEFSYVSPLSFLSDRELSFLSDYNFETKLICIGALKFNRPKHRLKVLACHKWNHRVILVFMNTRGWIFAFHLSWGSGWVSERTSKWVSERARVSEYLSYLVSERVSVWVSDSVSEWLSRVSEWVFLDNLRWWSHLEMGISTFLSLMNPKHKKRGESFFCIQLHIWTLEPLIGPLIIGMALSLRTPDRAIDHLGYDDWTLTSRGRWGTMQAFGYTFWFLPFGSSIGTKLLKFNFHLP